MIHTIKVCVRCSCAVFCCDSIISYRWICQGNCMGHCVYYFEKAWTKICWHVNKAKHNKAQTVCIILGIYSKSEIALPQKRKGRQDGCPDRQWRRWSLPSTSPGTTRAVNLTTFPFQWVNLKSNGHYWWIIIHMFHKCVLQVIYKASYVAPCLSQREWNLTKCQVGPRLLN